MRVLVISNLYPPDFLGGYELACGQAAEGLRGLPERMWVEAAVRSSVERGRALT